MIKTINLSFINTLDDRLRSENNLLQVILGPRQVGKTTTVLKLLQDNYKNQSIYYSADAIFNASPQWVLEIWNKAIHEKKVLVIDEIQKCQNWAEVIKKLYDASKRKNHLIRVVLLGSSSLEIQKGLTESLTGRFQLLQVAHWSFEESFLGYKLDFETYLKYGGYPGSYQFINQKDDRDWINYVKNSIILTVIEKDILQFQNIKNPSLFKQAFEIIMAYPAQEISYTKLLGLLQDKGNVELVKYYLKIYEGAFLVKTLEKFSAKKIKTKASSPKIIPMAPCFYYLNIQDKYSDAERGRIFEALVGSQLIKTGEDVYYWREKNDEVDFVLKKGKKIWAIEVKSGSKKSSKGLMAFKNQFKETKIIYIDSENYFEFEKSPIDFLEKNGV